VHGKDDKLELTIISDDGFSTIFIDAIQAFVVVLTVPILLYTYWDEVWSYTYVKEEWLRILFFGLYFVASIGVFFYIRKYMTGELKSVISAKGIDGDSWNSIVDLVIDYHGDTADIRFKTVLGTNRSYKVEMDSGMYEQVSEIKNLFFKPSNKVWTI